MRTETIQFHEFMADGYNRKKQVQNKKNLKDILKVSVTIPIVWDALKGSRVFAQEVLEVAAVPEATKQSILHAFDH